MMSSLLLIKTNHYGQMDNHYGLSLQEINQHKIYFLLFPQGPWLWNAALSLKSIYDEQLRVN